MDDVMSPEPLDPLSAMKEVITSLEEQVKTRVTSVENGRKFQTSGHGEADMPDGPSIFEAGGAWEDFSTPSRDLRLLIAIDVVRGFPDRVARRPERYAMPKDKSVAEVKAELQDVLASELAARKFSYTAQRRLPMDACAQGCGRTLRRARDGIQPERLRRAALGRARGKREASACKRHAPGTQRAKMREYRGVVPRAAPAGPRIAPAAPDDGARNI